MNLMTTKRIYIILISFLLFPNSHAQKTFTVDGISYYVTSSNTVKVNSGETQITSGGSYDEVVNIPSRVTYSDVTYSVTAIGANAFLNCKGLTSVLIPPSVTSIGTSAFKNCAQLVAIKIPPTITAIEFSTFFGCKNLKTVDVPPSVTYIDKFAFFECTGLSSVNIPNSVGSIGASAFCGCTGLTSVKIPASIDYIDEAVFEDCTALTSVTIPSSIHSIDAQAFSGCQSLNTISIPASVKNINHYAFYLSNLKSIELYGTTPPRLDDNPFSGMDPTIPVYVPATALTTYKNDTNWKFFTNIIGR